MAKILTKNSFTTGVTPSGLSAGEMAVNVVDKKIFVGNAVGGVVTLHDQQNVVTSVNGITGPVGITSGSNIIITKSASNTLRVGSSSRYLTLYNTSLYNVVQNNGTAYLCLSAPNSGAYLGDPLNGASGTYVGVDSTAARSVSPSRIGIGTHPHERPAL